MVRLIVYPLITIFNFFKQKLESLDLMENKIGVKGVKSLANALKDNEVNQSSAHIFHCHL